MAGNSKFATAIHVAGMLSFADALPLTSDAMAQSCKTNSVVIRRIVGQLTRAGLVTVKMGTGGGARLARPAADITLAEIYAAVEVGSRFSAPKLTGEQGCPVARFVRPVVAHFLRSAENAMIKYLSETTLADVIGEVRQRMCAANAGEIGRIEVSEVTVS